MRIQFSHHHSALLAVLGTSMLTLSGCAPGGGIAATTTVTIKPSESLGEDIGGNTTSGPATTASGVGTFRGQVVLEGAVAPLPFLVSEGSAIKDAEVCAAQDIPDEKLVLGEGNGVANAVVYLPKAPKGVEIPPPDGPAVFDQKGCRFLPHVLLIRTGRPLEVLSGDSVAHNTHTYPVRNQPLNTLVTPNERTGQVTVTYEKAESVPFPVKCDFHSWMAAYHLPLDHPWAAVTDENGNFEIPDLPAGKHKFRVWHESCGYIDRNLSVTITADGTTTEQITLPAEKVK